MLLQPSRIAAAWAGMSFVVILFWPETLASKILRLKAARLNKQKGVDQFIAPDDTGRRSFWQIMVRAHPSCPRDWECVGPGMTDVPLNRAGNGPHEAREACCGSAPLSECKLYGVHLRCVLHVGSVHSQVFTILVQRRESYKMAVGELPRLLAIFAHVFKDVYGLSPGLTGAIFTISEQS